MDHSYIMGPSEEMNELQRHINVHMEVKPTDEVNPGLQTCSVELANLLRSCYCKPPCSVCRNVTLCASTSAQCSINDGDTLHHQLEIRNLSVYIQNELKNNNETLLQLSPSITISRLKEMLLRDPENGANHVSESALALSFNERILDGSRTLADYSIQNYDVINLYDCRKYYKVSIGVPAYAKMEQVLFMPEDTIADVKSKVETKNPDLKDTANIRELYPIGLRGAVKNATDTTFFFYLDLFSEKMKIIIDARKGDRSFYYSSHLDDECTKDNLWKIICRKECIEECILKVSHKDYIKSYAFDLAWTQTFAPKIVAQAYSSNMPIPLFFFPLRTKIIQTRILDMSTQIKHFVSSITEKALHMKGVKRRIYYPQTNEFLHHKRKYVFHNYFMFTPASEPYAIIFTKPFKVQHRGYIPREHAGCVVIRWPTGKFSLKVNLSETVNSLRERIEDKIMVPFLMQKLTFDGKPMKGNSILKEIGIVDGSEIHLHPILDFE